VKVELDHLAKRIAAMDRVIDQTSSEHEGCTRMQAIPGRGPVTATAIVAAIGTARAFGKGRILQLGLGLVPRQHSTGGKQKLLGISNSGSSAEAQPSDLRPQ
jgi:transposase